MEKTKIARHAFSLVKKERITPSYVRATLKGEGAADFAACTTGANNKIFIPETFFGGSPVDEGYIRRTYTHRGVDLDRNEIIIDFIDHGPAGPASVWARSAEPGARIEVAMKIRKSALVAEASEYVLIGDATAIPVICCILESLPEQARGTCLIEVAGPRERHPEISHPGFEIRWCYNAEPERKASLLENVLELGLTPSKDFFAFVACEFDSVRKIRQYLRDELQLPRQQVYAYAYWKAGEAEDRSQQQRSTEKKDGESTDPL